MNSDFQFFRSSPEAQGISSGAIDAFITAVEREVRDLHSFMLLRHGAVVAEGWWNPYRAEDPHMLFSLSKSFTSTAIGLAISEGLLTLDDPLISYFPADLPAEVSPNLAAMKIRHLLAMCTGHDVDTTQFLYGNAEGNWAQAFLAQPVVHEPGTHFLYNTGATYMLSAVLQKVAGVKLIDYLRPRLFDPLGIQNPTWQTCPRGINTGGFGLKIKTEDIARFGQLYLQKGIWNGQRLVPAAWIEQATAKQISNGSGPDSDWEQGYGYQFWRCRHNAYRGDGAFGQYCIVMPELDAVLAITSGLVDMQQVLNLVWNHLLPGIGPGGLAANPAAAEKLQQRLTRLSITPPAGQSAPAAAPAFGGKTYRLEANPFELNAFCFDQDLTHLHIIENGQESVFALGNGSWAASSAPLIADPSDPNHPTQPVVGSYAWMAGNALEVTLRYPQTPFVYTLRFTFDGLEAVVAARVNVSFGPSEFPPLRGSASAA